MVFTPGDKLPLCLLSSCMRDDYRAAIVRRALAFASETSTAAQAEWRQVLRQAVRVSGFRDAGYAPPTLLLPAVAEAFEFAGRIVSAVLTFWVESQAELRAAWEELLVECGVMATGPGQGDWHWEGTWGPELHAAMAKFQRRHQAYGWDDAALMLCCLTRRLPGGCESQAQAAAALGATSRETNNLSEGIQQIMAGTKWEQWLADLRALEVDAPEWQTWEQFQREAEQLAAAKRAEGGLRAQLATQLAALRRECSDALSYFNFADCAAWSGAGLPAAVAPDVVAQLEQWHAALARHAELRAQPPARREDAHRQWQELMAFEERILALHAALAPMLGGAPAPAAANEEAGRSAAAEPDATEAEAPRAAENLARNVSEPADATIIIQATSAQSESNAADETPTAPPLLIDRTSAPLAPAIEADAPRPDEGRFEEHAPEAAATPPGPVEESSSTAGSTTVAAEDKAEDKDQGAPLAVSVPAPDLENWTALLWQFLLADDVPGAYWLARSWVTQGVALPAPDWLLAAVQGAYWLRAETDPLATELAEIARQHQPGGDKAQEMLGLAASLHTMLIAPGSGLNLWLKDCMPPLREIVAAVRDFAALGKPLRVEDWAGAAGADRREAGIKQAAMASRNWLDQAPGWRTRMRGASDVWQQWVGPKGALRALLQPAADDDRNAAARLQPLLQQWRDRNFIIQQMNERYRALHDNRVVKPIVGVARNQLVRDTQDACELARRWCELVGRARSPQAADGTLAARIAQLRKRLPAALPEAAAALSELSRTPGHSPSAAAAHCLWHTLRQLQQTLGLESDADAATTADWLRDESDSLAVALNRRLLWLPEIELDDDGQPPAEAVLHIAAALREAAATHRSTAQAIEGWLARLDFRFAPRLLEVLPEGAEKIALAARHATELEGARGALRARVARIRDEIEQAVVDGLIAEERSDYSAEIEALDPDQVLNFAPAYARLEGVQGCLREARQQRLAELRVRWEEMAGALGRKLTAEQFEQVSSLLDAAFAQEDTRVVDECLARLAEVLTGGSDFKESWLSPVPQRDMLAQFLNAAREISERLRLDGLPGVLAAIQHGRSVGEIKFGQLARERRAETIQAVRAWQGLKQQGAGGQQNAQHMKTILRYLGFTAPQDEGAVRIEGRGSDWLHAKARMSASEFLVKPIPQFGSEARGEYDVVCLWERLGVDTIGARLHDLHLDARNLLVLYLGRLTERQRNEVAHLSRKHELAVAMLDEVLLLFLTGESDDRLRPFLRCALPYAAVNPYTPFKAGDVPPEMFFGRAAMVREMQREGGSCLVYGGRQLGKSAMLRHTERDFHHPEREQYAWVRDMRLVFDPQAGKDASHVWLQLRDDFQREGLLTARKERSDTIAQSIREAMERAPARRVLVMFDEADEFLAADASDDFRTVIALRELMDNTQRRFKFIFAGLQNVQRFQGIPNQPLAHLGRPLLVGPLEAREAQRLVREPFEALGYRFDNEATVLLVLSYTNYHAGLIQLFCHELLKRLRARAGGAPPYHIARTEVEAVYRLPQVRRDIRDRLDWTLALRPHYQALAWAMITDQMETRDSYARTYSAGELLALGRDWWLQGFGSFSTDELRGLLDEMCGLGVLVSNEQGRYRLRSPNLVRLMGSEEDVGHRLIELSYKTPEVSFAADSYHARLDRDARHYSPLTYAQERMLNKSRYGVGLIFASEALGRSQLAAAVERFIPEHLPEHVRGECTPIPAEIAAAPQLEKWLRDFQRQRQKHERLVVYQSITGAPESLAARVQEALRFCQRHRQSQQQWMRVLLLFDATAAWDWLSLPSERRQPLEEQADAVVIPRRWGLTALSQRLAQHDQIGTEDVCREVLRVTGGWPWLLDQLFARCQKPDPRPCALELEQELTAPGSALARDFRQHLGVVRQEAAWRVVQFLRAEGPLNRSLVVPEFLGEPALSAAQCETAIEYLLRLGCLEIQDEALHLEPLVQRACAER